MRVRLVLRLLHSYYSKQFSTHTRILMISVSLFLIYSITTKFISILSIFRFHDDTRGLILRCINFA